MSEHFESGGEVESGYESVRDLFLSNFYRDHQEDRAQFCAYVRGKKVVDIWASRLKAHENSKWGSDPGTYGPNCVQNVFSSSKVITSLVVAMLVDRGFLQYDQLIMDIWPEYGQHGKESTTVEMLMKHEAGLPKFTEEISAEDLTAESIKNGKISSVIERQKPKTTPGSKRVYHPVTRGFIVNEVVRRADPKGRTIGEFIREEISESVLKPLGYENELVLGMPNHLAHIPTPLVKRHNSWTYRQLLLPNIAGGGKVVGANLPLRALFAAILPVLQLVEFLQVGDTIGITPTRHHEPGRGLDTALEWFNHPQVRQAELPSANAHASARALAAVANAIVEDGNEKLLSGHGKKTAHDNCSNRQMHFGALPSGKMNFTNAGWCKFGNERSDYVGWMGLGGSACQWHTEEQIAIGYSMNAYEIIPWNARAKSLQEQVLLCARKQRKESADIQHIPDIRTPADQPLSRM